MKCMVRHILQGICGGVAVWWMSGCSSQDFGRPIAGLADVVDSGHAYVESDEEELARLRAERLARALAEWDRERGREIVDYNIGADDELRIEILALKTPGEIEVLKPVVGKDGTISLPLTGVLSVEGLTARQAEARIADAYRGRFLKDPQIVVSVSQFRSSPVVVTGAVAKPGLFFLRQNRSSVLEILSDAGGVSPAAGRLLFIVRRGGGERDNQTDLPLREALDPSSAPETDAPDSSAAPEAPPADNRETDAEEVAAGSDAGDDSEASAAAERDAEPAPSSFWARLFRRGSAGTQVAETDPPEEAQEAAIEADGTGREHVEDLADLPADVAAVVAESEAADEQPDVVVVDLEHLLDQGDIRLNVPVFGGDIISLPPRRREYVYVLGYVQAPGAVELRDPRGVEALQAVAMAGGLSPTARAQNSFLIRQDELGRRVIDVDLTKIARGTRPPLFMKAGDTLVIGSSFMAKLSELIRPSVGASASVAPVP